MLLYICTYRSCTGAKNTVFCSPKCSPNLKNSFFGGWLVIFFVRLRKWLFYGSKIGVAKAQKKRLNSGFIRVSVVFGVFMRYNSSYGKIQGKYPL
ncbi:MAG: hypothetical protein Q4C98_03190 [Capnocytophaga sp.]|nr:hypothetical protein [Capnocytophaga sp.]